jgi:Arc/MetJ-type ribon-helix-helix transcriptional regulator
MRTTKIITFSVPPAIESLIHKHAEREHMTVSEFLREAVRRYIAIAELEALSNTGEKMTKKKKLRESDVQKWVSESRRKKIK